MFSGIFVKFDSFLLRLLRFLGLSGQQSSYRVQILTAALETNVYLRWSSVIQPLCETIF